MPGYAGGVEWNGPALDPANRQLVTGAVDVCFMVKLGETKYVPGEASFGGTIEPVGPTTGWITAIDSETGAVRWKYDAEKPVMRRYPDRRRDYVRGGPRRKPVGL